MSRYKIHLTKHLSAPQEIVEKEDSFAEALAQEHTIEESLYKCSTCSRTYRTKHFLRRHILTHGEKKFLCNECGKCFVTKAGLESHLKVILLLVLLDYVTCLHCTKLYRIFVQAKQWKLNKTKIKKDCLICFDFRFTQEKSHTSVSFAINHLLTLAVSILTSSRTLDTSHLNVIPVDGSSHNSRILLIIKERTPARNRTYVLIVVNYLLWTVIWRCTCGRIRGKHLSVAMYATMGSMIRAIWKNIAGDTKKLVLSRRNSVLLI